MPESSANRKMCKGLVADGDRLVSEENGGSLHGENPARRLTNRSFIEVECSYVSAENSGITLALCTRSKLRYGEPSSLGHLLVIDNHSPQRFGYFGVK